MSASRVRLTGAPPARNCTYTSGRPSARPTYATHFPSGEMAGAMGFADAGTTTVDFNTGGDSGGGAERIHTADVTIALNTAAPAAPKSSVLPCRGCDAS